MTISADYTNTNNSLISLRFIRATAIFGTTVVGATDVTLNL